MSRRAKPYEIPPKRPSTSTTTAATSKPYDAATTDQTTAANPPETSKTKQPDTATVTRLFQLLIPIMVREPATFESKATVICAALDLDSVAATDIINAVKQNIPPDSKPEQVHSHVVDSQSS